MWYDNGSLSILMQPQSYLAMLVERELSRYRNRLEQVTQPLLAAMYMSDPKGFKVVRACELRRLTTLQKAYTPTFYSRSRKRQHHHLNPGS